jgi:hypothetical protein
VLYQLAEQPRFSWRGREADREGRGLGRRSSLNLSVLASPGSPHGTQLGLIVGHTRRWPRSTIAVAVFCPALPTRRWAVFVIVGHPRRIACRLTWVWVISLHSGIIRAYVLAALRVRPFPSCWVLAQIRSVRGNGRV